MSHSDKRANYKTVDVPLPACARQTYYTFLLLCLWAEIHEFNLEDNKKKSLSFLEIVIESRPQCLLFSVTCWCRRLGNKQKWWRPRGIGGCRGQTGRWQQTRSRVQPNCIVFVLFSSLLWPFIRSFLHATIPFPSKYIKRHGGRLGEEQLEEENSPKKNASQCFPEKSTISNTLLSRRCRSQALACGPFLVLGCFSQIYRSFAASHVVASLPVSSVPLIVVLSLPTLLPAEASTV